MFSLQCALEEGCLASPAYSEPVNSHRRLLRFTTAVTNTGTAAFRPNIPRSAWDWHACHQHYHSMETFSHFQLFDTRGRQVNLS